MVRLHKAIRLLRWGWLVAMLLPSAWALQLEQHLDRNVLHADETMTLTIQADRPLPAEAMDIRPLFSRFIIGALRFTLVDGGQHSRWEIPLTARPDQPWGSLALPALAVTDTLHPDGTMTHTLPLRVRYQAGSANPAALPTVVEGSLLLAPKNPGGLGLYQLRIRLLPGVQIDKIAPPMLADVSLIPWGDDQQRSERVAGQNVPVIERLYLIRPQHTGKQTLWGAQVEGSYLAAHQRRPFRQTTADSTLEIAARPTDAPVLQSEQIRLSARWMPPPQRETAQNHPPTTDNAPRVGAPLHFQITMQGAANLATDLPDITPVDSPAWKIYLDQTESQEQRQGDTLLATRVLHYIALPQQAGQHPLPPLTIPWWNTLTQQRDDATVTLVTPHIAPASLRDTEQAAAQDVTPHTTSRLGYAALIVLVSGCLGVLLWPTRICTPWRQFLHRRWQSHRHWQQLGQAIASGNPERTQLALLRWAQWRWPGQAVTGLTTLPCYPQMANELDALLAACYAPTPAPWQGTSLRQALQRWRPAHLAPQQQINPEGLF